MKGDLEWWVANVSTELRHISHGSPQIVIQTDASLLGWGGILSDNEIGDNTTAVAYISNMGGTKSIDCNTISRQIWLFCKDNDIWLTCTHIAGKENLADKKSREFDDKLEWKLEKFVYLFPPFSLLSRCIFKIREDGARGVVIAPFWQTQTWFPRLMQLLTDNPIVLPKNKKILNLPHDPQSVHPLHKKMKLIACPSVRSSFRERGFSKETTHILMSSWKSSTKKQYQVYIRKWFKYCNKKQINCFQISVGTVLEFFTTLFKEGNLGYSSLNLARGALSSLGLTIDSIPVGRHCNGDKIHERNF
ncbi:Hypothetical predicted protein [Mytilus galloprovincialis]|uniref:Uncharacterized protein n=1 Tax=Mytilus galloprovincialis TaxID=29158 RepID=A0A8B6GNR2_MYTGA|nr:Hypothetical predicted protein [Mytilus galloprovincialis]